LEYRIVVPFDSTVAPQLAGEPGIELKKLISKFKIQNYDEK